MDGRSAGYFLLGKDTIQSYYWTEQFIKRDMTKRPSDESPTDQEHRLGDRVDQANRV